MEISRISGFENFVNYDIGNFTVAEILSTYTDGVLRKNGFKADPDQFVEHLDLIVKLFSHLSEKDIFISSYKVFLARRLLMEKFESLDYEKSFITKLKVTCGR
jgi:cullin 1